MTIQMVALLLLAYCWVYAMDQRTERKQITRDQHGQLDDCGGELANFIDKDQGGEEKQSEEWKQLDLRKIVFIAAIAKETG